jgi:hypothetical protein
VVKDLPKALSAEEREAMLCGHAPNRGMRELVTLIDALTEYGAEAVARMTVAERQLETIAKQAPLSFERLMIERDCALDSVRRAEYERDAALARVEAAERALTRVQELLPEWERQTPGVLTNGYTERCAKQVRSAIGSVVATRAESETAALRLTVQVREEQVAARAAEAAALRAENERLRAELPKAFERGLRTSVAHDQLAAANALLERIYNWHGPHGLTVTVMNEIRAHLAGQPAQPAMTLERRLAELGLHHMGESSEDVKRRLEQPAAPDLKLWSGRGSCPYCRQPHERTEYCRHRAAAEQRVLDACAATDFTLEGHITEESDETAIGLAELARREGK